MSKRIPDAHARLIAMVEAEKKARRQRHDRAVDRVRKLCPNWNEALPTMMALWERGKVSFDADPEVTLRRAYELARKKSH